AQPMPVGEAPPQGQTAWLSAPVAADAGTPPAGSAPDWTTPGRVQQPPRSGGTAYGSPTSPAPAPAWRWHGYGAANPGPVPQPRASAPAPAVPFDAAAAIEPTWRAAGTRLAAASANPATVADPWTNPRMTARAVSDAPAYQAPPVVRQASFTSPQPAPAPARP